MRNIQGNGFVSQEKKDTLRFWHSTVLELLKLKTHLTRFLGSVKKDNLLQIKILPSVQDFHQVSYVFKVGKKSFETLYIRNVLH